MWRTDYIGKRAEVGTGKLAQLLLLVGGGIPGMLWNSREDGQRGRRETFRGRTSKGGEGEDLW